MHIQKGAVLAAVDFAPGSWDMILRRDNAQVGCASQKLEGVLDVLDRKLVVTGTSCMTFGMLQGCRWLHVSWIRAEGLTHVTQSWSLSRRGAIIILRLT